jgi:cytochrome c oxidase subunit 2
MRMNSIIWMSTIAIISGCTGNQSALSPTGAPAIHIANLMSGIVAVCTLVWLLVIVMLVWALLRKRSDARENTRERGLTMTVSAAVGATAVIITGMTIASFYTTRDIGVPGETALTITVRGQQWWWQVIYADPDPALTFQTANEIHIPVGRDVRIQLESADVVHSFWVPSLAGKQDLVPGRSNSLLLRAERPGVYRGQCAEFCGLQHTHMAMLVIAENPATMNAGWCHNAATASCQPTPMPPPGHMAFLAKPCAACHTVRGTPAIGTTGPDLTHIGSRRTIAAGLLETTPGSLAAWIADPQTLKPGNNMPMVPLTSDELKNISAYMESLK